MSRLKGKIAVVTGASRGIGAAIAKRLASDGATVVVNYARSAKAAEDLVERIVAEGGAAIAAKADVSDAGQVKGLFEAARKKFGRVDIVVNNAGVFASAPLAESTVEHYRQVFDINVQGPLTVAAEALKHFPAAGGRIVNISSVVARVPFPGSAVYSASKAAVDAFTMNWAVELGPRRITVNSVAPGLTESDMSAQVPKEAQEAIAARTPLGRVGQPGDIADVVAFLVSDDARWITGQSILASGGLTS